MRSHGTADQGCPIVKPRFHPRERLLASVAGPRAEVFAWRWDESGALVSASLGMLATAS